VSRAFLLLVTLAAGGCASTGAVPTPRPFPGAAAPLPAPDATPPPADAPPPEAVVADLHPPSRFDPGSLVQTALGFRGVPYRNGGTDPSGFDCSGFVQYVFRQHGLALPREVREQFVFGDPIAPENAREGDLVYFSTVAPGPSHVGLIVGAGQFVHAPSSRGVVRVERLAVAYWASRLLAIKRIR
jgi:cell wall-associated NlpC family hydrolase